jgi:hypothetical protein
MIEILIDMGDAVNEVASKLSEWSQTTFGADTERGPIGPLKHLAKEAKEAEEACTLSGLVCQELRNSDKVREELADCLILILDASRRAGIKPLQLFKVASDKLDVNKKRTWPKPVSDEPVEHVRNS